MSRILIADDHDSLRRGLAQGIAEAGHDVEEAANGNTAIEKLCDRMTKDFDADIRRIKDMGSAAIGVTLIATAAIWVFAVADYVGM